MTGHDRGEVQEHPDPTPIQPPHPRRTPIAREKPTLDPSRSEAVFAPASAAPEAPGTSRLCRRRYRGGCRKGRARSARRTGRDGLSALRAVGEAVEATPGEPFRSHAPAFSEPRQVAPQGPLGDPEVGGHGGRLGGSVLRQVGEHEPVPRLPPAQRRLLLAARPLRRIGGRLRRGCGGVCRILKRIRHAINMAITSMPLQKQGARARNKISKTRKGRDGDSAPFTDSPHDRWRVGGLREELEGQFLRK